VDKLANTNLLVKYNRTREEKEEIKRKNQNEPKKESL
jgi:hypothetical protein